MWLQLDENLILFDRSHKSLISAVDLIFILEVFLSCLHFSLRPRES